jgi:hypothetical protein
MEPRNGGLAAPGELRAEEFLLRPIRASDAAFDYEAVMESKAFLRAWEQSGWPKEGFTVEANRDDLARLERRHDEGASFTYTVVGPALDQSLGCVYVFPTSADLFGKAQIAATGGARWEDYEVAVYFWVRRSRLVDGLDTRLLDALDVWFSHQWNVKQHLLLTNELVEQQVELLESTGRTLRFELAYSSKPGKELAYSRSWGKSAVPGAGGVA